MNKIPNIQLVAILLILIGIAAIWWMPYSLIGVGVLLTGLVLLYFCGRNP